MLLINAIFLLLIWATALLNMLSFQTCTKADYYFHPSNSSYLIKAGKNHLVLLKSYSVGNKSFRTNIFSKYRYFKFLFPNPEDHPQQETGFNYMPKNSLQFTVGADRIVKNQGRKKQQYRIIPAVF